MFYLNFSVRGGVCELRWDLCVKFGEFVELTKILNYQCPLELLMSPIYYEAGLKLCLKNPTICKDFSVT
jgi:hypothetical protein